MTHRPRVLFVDDDPFSAREYIDALSDEGFEVIFVKSVRKALDTARAGDFDAVILDVRMSPGGQYTAIETAGGFATGISLARDIQELLPGAALVALTGSKSPEVQEFFTKDRYTRYFYRPQTPPEQFCRNVKHLLRFDVSPKVFLVHGRDHATRDATRRYLSDHLRIRDVIVLAEETSAGMTIIEKLERSADDADLVFVLLTPDDFVETSARPRQNVVLEYGYFLGKLGRLSGRVIVLKKGDLELPSDISGVVYIDITQGFDTVESLIRKEIADWL